MGRNEVIRYLMDSCSVSFSVALQALRDKGWDMVLAHCELQEQYYQG
ncbi:MAG: hypothetical protein H6R25_1481 [Proteobacteria bacterium]|nr:hypothetical protein [Pseudomonadota bacterium]